MTTTTFDPTLEAIVAKLAALNICGTITGVRVGPVVSTALFRLDATTRVSAVVHATEDLSVVARGPVHVFTIPGADVVGIQYPNSQRQLVEWDQLIWNDAVRSIPRDNVPLAIPLGVDAYGSPVVIDLAELPHLLVAGSTGSGKSNALHAIILSLLVRNSCDEMKLVLIDPKAVELAPYAPSVRGRGLPQLWKFATDYEQALLALYDVGAEVERRYQLMGRSGVRSAHALGLPAIVVVIDELADLMTQTPAMRKTLEIIITRIAQKARAAGVHLIVATQRPSVNVVTGVIKANLPARLCLRLPSGHDSRTVIDVVGAEHLLGNGDALYVGPSVAGNGSDSLRVQCPLVTDGMIQNMIAAQKWPVGRWRRWWQGLWRTDQGQQYEVQVTGYTS